MESRLREGGQVIGVGMGGGGGGGRGYGGSSSYTPAGGGRGYHRQIQGVLSS